MIQVRNPQCNLCELHKTTSNVCIGGTGNPSSKIMVIAEAPGAEEEKQGIPLVGRSGKLLNASLEKAGMKREDVFVTNCVQCRPPGNRKPSEEEVSICASNYLIKEYQELNPNYILLLGNTALHSLTIRRGITKNRGIILFPDHLFYIDESPVVYATFHPSHALRSLLVKEEFEKDIQDFAAIIKGHH